MSHSDDHNQQAMQKSRQKYLDLYQLRKSAIASTLHSDLAQPIVAAKSFASSIMSLENNDLDMQEAKNLASIVLEMTDQAYTVAYDLMLANETDMAANSDHSMQSIIEKFGVLLRLNDRGIALNVSENASSILLDRFVQVVILDWIKTLLIYLVRHTQVTNVDVSIVASDLGMHLEIHSNAALNSEQSDSELVFINIRKQLQVLAGSLSIECTDEKSSDQSSDINNNQSDSYSDNQSQVSIVIPLDGSMLTAVK